MRQSIKGRFSLNIFLRYGHVQKQKPKLASEFHEKYVKMIFSLIDREVEQIFFNRKLNFKGLHSGAVGGAVD